NALAAAEIGEDLPDIVLAREAGGEMGLLPIAHVGEATLRPLVVVFLAAVVEEHQVEIDRAAGGQRALRPVGAGQHDLFAGCIVGHAEPARFSIDGRLHGSAGTAGGGDAPYWRAL